MSFLTSVTISSKVVICNCPHVAELMQSRTNHVIISANESAGELSIIIVMWKGDDLLRGCLDSLARVAGT